MDKLHLSLSFGKAAMFQMTKSQFQFQKDHKTNRELLSRRYDELAVPSSHDIAKITSPRINNVFDRNIAGIKLHETF